MVARASGEEPGGPSYAADWARLHGGVDPTGSPLVGRWVRLMAALARPLARRNVAPTVVTAAAVAVAAGAAAVAGQAQWRAVVTALLVVLSGMLDGLDGAVAVLRGRASSWGYVVDSVADRVADGLFLVALWRLGASGGVVVAAGAALVLLEYTRARAGAAGMAAVGVVSVGERPTRVIVTVMTCLTAAVIGHWSFVTTCGTAAVLALSAAGWVQVVVVARRALQPR